MVQYNAKTHGLSLKNILRGYTHVLCFIQHNRNCESLSGLEGTNVKVANLPQRWEKKNNLLTIEKSEGERMTGRKKVTGHFMIPLYLRESYEQ